MMWSVNYTQRWAKWRGRRTGSESAGGDSSGSCLSGRTHSKASGKGVLEPGSQT